MTQIGLGKLQGRIQSRNRKITLTWRCWSASDLSECDLGLGRNVFAQPRPKAVIGWIEILRCSGLIASLARTGNFDAFKVARIPGLDVLALAHKLIQGPLAQA